MKFLMIKSLWPEKKGFSLDRNIGDNYIFLHFLTPAVVYFDYGEVKVEPGGCIFFEIYQNQHFASPDCDLLHDWFHADASLKELMDKYGLECFKVYYPYESDEITKIITDIELEYLQKDKYYEEISNAEVEKMFAKIARSVSNEENKNSIDVQRRDEFIEIRSQIHMNFNEDWTIEKMAKLANLSTSRFFYLYKTMFGISPQKDLCITRIQRAQIMLMQNNCSVERAAELCGYKNQYHFIRQFKQKTGMTPGKYKKTKGNF